MAGRTKPRIDEAVEARREPGSLPPVVDTGELDGAAFLPDFDADDEASAGYLRAMVQEALAETGPGIPLDESFARIEERLRREVRRREVGA